MTDIEHLKTELARAEDAELQSEEQLRQMLGLIDKACAPNPSITASDCAKLVTAARDLNTQLKARADRLRLKIKAQGLTKSMRS